MIFLAELSRKRKSEDEEEIKSQSKKAREVVHSRFFVDENDSELVKFKRIAQCLQTSPELQEIDTIIKKVESTPVQQEVPFIFLGGSSGTGKTQTAIAIRERYRPERIVLYVLASLAPEESQRIYKTFDNVTSSFKRCVSRDVESMINAEHAHCQDLRAIPLFCFGFAKAVFEGRIEEEIERASFEDANKRLEGKPRPIILIDEFAVKDQIRLRFMRNVFRCLRCVLIISGTNSSAANLLPGLEISGGDGSLPWCYIVGNLPKFRLECSGFNSLIDILAPTLKKILLNSRPLFAQVGCERLLISHSNLDFRNERNLVEMIDAIALEAANRANIRKKMFAREGGVLGQVSIFKNLSYETNDYVPSDLINYHFASLVSPAANKFENFFVDTDGNVNGLKWIICTRYDDAQTDVLMHLSLPGCKGFSAFGESSSFLAFLIKWRSKEVFRTRYLNWSENSNQKSNDGLFLEDCTSICICAASRVSGVSGVSLLIFLKTLTFHLFGTEWDCEHRGRLKFLSSKMIPFCSVMNQKWMDEFKSIPNSRFGHLSREKNVDRLDLRCVPFSEEKDVITFSAECKDWDRNLDLPCFERIVSNIPEQSQLHLVFTRNLQSEFYVQNVRTYMDTFGEDDRAKDFIFFKLHDNGKVKLDEIRGLPSKVAAHDVPPSCVVLFFLCPVEMSPRTRPFVPPAHS
jgi:hypothetical protein